MMVDDGVEPDPWDAEGAPFNAVGAGGVRVLAQPCGTCIFRGDSVISRARVEEMVQTACERDSAIICHATLDLDKQAVCRGFYARHASDTAPLRLAAWLGCVDEVPSPAK
jgi:hypothetical protein